MSRYKLRPVSGPELGAAITPDKAYQYFEDTAQQLTLEDRWTNDEHAHQALVSSYYHPSTNRNAPVAFKKPHDATTLHHQLFDAPHNYDQETKDRNWYDAQRQGRTMTGHTGRKAELVRLLNPYDV